MARSPDARPSAEWAAARRLADAGDLDALAEHLRCCPATPALGARLLAHPDVRVGQLLLSWLRRPLKRCGDADTLRAWAAALPQDLGRWPPQVQRSLARLHDQLRPFVDALPDWRAAVTSEPAAIAWLTTAIARDAAAIAAEGATERLLHAVSGLEGAELADPLGVVDALRCCGAPAGPALRLLAEARAAATVSAAQADAALRPWLEAGDASAWQAALEPWCSPAVATPALIDAALAEPALAAHAIAALARRGDGAALLDIASGARPGPQPLALRHAGAFVERASDLLAVAQRDPLAYGAPLRGALGDAHRRGVFVQPADLVPLLAIFVVHRAWPARDLVDLCHVARDGLVERIGARPTDDPHWPRLIEVLALSDGRGADAAVRAILAEATAPATIRAAIEAAGRREDNEAEAAVLTHLPQHPPEALRALTRIGSSSTAQVLREALGLGSDGEPAAWLIAWQTEALVLLWQLTPARSADRVALLQRINPSAIPAPIAADVAAERSDAARRLALTAALFIRPDEALVRIADLGEDGAFDTLYGLLREAVVGLFDGTVPGDSPFDTAHTSGRPDLPNAVRDALLQYGRRLHARGRIRPVCLTREAEPGAAMLVEACLDLALFGGLEPAMERCLLDALQPHVVPGIAERIDPLLRSRSDDVRAAAIRLLVARVHAERPHTLARLLREEAPASLRPALAAMAEFKVVGLSAMVGAHVASARIDVARAAADALVRLDAAVALGPILAQLARQDAPGLRRALLLAYDAADRGLGPLIDAIAAEDHATRRERLVTALNRRLSAAALRRLVVAGRPVADVLLDAIRAGSLTLDGNLDRLDGELIRAGHPPLRQPSTAPLDRLRRGGWSAELGEAVLLDPTTEPGRLVRRYGRELLAVVERLSDEGRTRLAIGCAELPTDVARAALPQLIDLLDGATHPAARAGLVALFSRVGPGLPSFLAGRCADAIRRLAAPLDHPRLRWDALNRLSATPTRADLQACLADAGDPRVVLGLAFQARRVPAVPPDWALDGRAPPSETPRTSRVGGLIAAWPLVDGARQAAILDALEALQPLGAPPWILESATPTPAVAAAQPSRALKQRAVEALDMDDRERRSAAAQRLLDWPDVPDAQLEVLLAWLDDRVDVSVDRQWVLADALDAHPDRLRCVRGIELIEWLPLARRRRHATRLWVLSQDGDPAIAAAARVALSRLGPAFLLPRVVGEVEACNWDAVAVLGDDSPLPRCPLLDRLLDTLRSVGRGHQARALESRAVPGPLGTPAPRPAPRPAKRADHRLARIEAARGDDPQAARMALKALVEAKAPGTLDLLVDLTRHPDPARRILALRAVRQLADQATYLDAALPFLDDERPDVRRSVIEAVSEARHPEALPKLVELLRHSTRTIRDAARNGVIRYREAALPALEHARRRARPDRRALYATVISAIRDLVAPGLVDAGDDAVNSPA